MGVINWLNSYSGAITAFATVVLMGTTVVLARITWRYVRLTREILEENRLMRLEAQKPEIAIYLRSHQAHIVLKYLRVENIGTGPAHDVRFKTDLSFSADGETRLEEVRFLRDGINYLQPGGNRDCFLSSLVNRPDLFEKSLEISVTYKDSMNKEHERCFLLDFGEGEGSSHDGAPLFEIAKAMKGIEKSLGSISTKSRQFGGG